jgi:DNA-binding transcriptional LysR family regulator
VLWEMVREGLGFGIMLEDIAVHFPEVCEVLAAQPPISVPVWLVTHREMKTSRRIRMVFDTLAEAILAQAIRSSVDAGS